MLLSSAKTSATYELVPPGPHTAYCIGVYHLGTIQLKGKPWNRVRLVWELPEDKMSDGRPMVTSRTYGWSMRPDSPLRVDLEGWRTAPFTDAQLETFDTAALLGPKAALCQVNIAHSKGKGGNGDKVYDNVTSVTALHPAVRAQFAAYKPANPQVYYCYEQGRDAVYQALPEFIRKMVDECDEWKAPQKPADDVPMTHEGDGGGPEDETLATPF